MSAMQYAIRARVLLCERWPEMTRYSQSEMLVILERAFNMSEDISTRAGQLEKKPAAGRDIPPSVENVAAYLKELQSDLNPQDFMDFYTTRDWTVDARGKIKMKDWHSAARRADRLWARPAKSAGLSEWERGKKEERMRALKTRLRELTNPGGSAWSVELTGTNRDKARELSSQIFTIEQELKT